jgi:flagellar export protein FliJ
VTQYKFRLKAVEKLRTVRRDQSRAALADAFRAEQVLAENLASVAKEQVELRELQRAATSGQYVDVSRLVDVQQYEIVLRARQQEMTRQESLLNIETERRRLALVEAEREMRVIELLDKRQRLEHERVERRKDTKHLDEIAAGMQWRGRRSTP